MSTSKKSTETRKTAILRILAKNPKRALNAEDISRIGKFPLNFATTRILAELHFAGLAVRVEGRRVNGRRCAYYKLTRKGAEEVAKPTLPNPRMSLFMQHTLRVFIDRPDREMYGAEICRIDEALKGSSIYPTLRRLEAAGWLTSRAESIDPRATGRPARVYYKITRHGLEEAQKALADAAGRIPQRPKADDHQQ